MLGFCSCQKEISYTVESPQVDVYVAGFVADDGSSHPDDYSLGNYRYLLDEHPTYWKNGSPVELPGFIDGYVGARALSIAVSGNDVYVAGYKVGWSPRTNPIPHGVYWKNGIPAEVFSRSGFPENPYELSSLVVSNNDVYMVGELLGSSATYYKNENPIDLSYGSRALSIAVSGNDAYVCGAKFNGTNYVAVYWKNGYPVNLTDGSKEVFATSIAVSGNDVYVAGTEYNGPIGIAKYWKNAILVNQTDGITRTEANSIAVSGNDVYMAGTQWEGNLIQNSSGTTYRNPIAKYWKNGNPIKLTDGSKWAEAKSIVVSGTDVYVAGFEDGVAKYWKNGSPVILGDVSKYSEAWSIFLAKK